MLQRAGICQFPRSSTSTLDSIQCHSISQCNAHAAAYRCTGSRNETTAVSTGTSLLSVPPLACNRSSSDRMLPTVHQDITGNMARARNSCPAAFTQILFFSYTSLFIHRRYTRVLPRFAAIRSGNGFARFETHYRATVQKLRPSEFVFSMRRHRLHPTVSLVNARFTAAIPGVRRL